MLLASSKLLFITTRTIENCHQYIYYYEANLFSRQSLTICRMAGSLVLLRENRTQVLCGIIGVYTGGSSLSLIY